MTAEPYARANQDAPTGTNLGALAMMAVAARLARRRGKSPPPSPRKPRKAERPRCGARCRSKGGAPCVAPVVVTRGPDGRVRVRARCRMHGGLSTGAKTAEGRARVVAAVRAAQRERWRRWREEKQERSTANGRGSK